MQFVEFSGVWSNVAKLVLSLIVTASRMSWWLLLCTSVKYHTHVGDIILNFNCDKDEELLSLNVMLEIEFLVDYSWEKHFYLKWEILWHKYITLQSRTVQNNNVS